MALHASQKHRLAGCVLINKIKTTRRWKDKRRHDDLAKSKLSTYAGNLHAVMING